MSDLPRADSVGAFIAARSPDQPVHLLRPHRLAATARTFLDGFPGTVLYAVKCNAHPLVLRTLRDQGLRHFDVASPMEIQRVADNVPDGAMFYHHPAKSPEQIAFARRHGVRHYAVDCPQELLKVLEHAGPDAVPMVRLAIPKGAGAVYDLSTKFGADPDTFVETLKSAAARGTKPGVTFHVGSQCLDPNAFALGVRLACQALDQAGVSVSLMDVGGGFPAYYSTTQAPPLDAYFDVLRQCRRDFADARGIELLCEPGRALAAEGGSLLTRVLLRKPEAVYLNDGIFGGLTEVYWGKTELTLALRVFDAQGRRKTGPTQPFTAYGPTCDGNDFLPYKLNLPADADAGDYIEFNLIGAYGREMAARYNGMSSELTAQVDDDFTE